MSEGDLVVYTAIFGGYDRLRPIRQPDSSVDYVCFTDNLDQVSSGWQLREIDLDGKQPFEKNRELKFFPNRYLGSYATSVYIDGNIEVTGSVSSFLSEQPRLTGLAIPRHPDRTCVYSEAETCLQRGLVDPQKLSEQLDRYLGEGMPRDFGLTENNLIYRNHDDDRVWELMSLWWAELSAGVSRDQICLPYLIWKYGYELAYLEQGPRVSSRYFQIHMHRSREAGGVLRRYARNAVARRRQKLSYSIAARLVDLCISAKTAMSRAGIRK